MSQYSVGGWRWSVYARQFLAQHRVCALCGKPIDPTLRHPHPMSGTVDHKTPVSLGGSRWDPANHQAAHRRCNVSRGAKVARPVGDTSRAW